MKNIVVFASGSGSNFQSIIDASHNGDLNANIAGLICNKNGIHALERASKHGIPSIIISEKNFTSHDAYCAVLLKHLQLWKADLLVLAGFLQKIHREIINAFPDRILNIHPALLPKFGGKGFYGSTVHQAVIDAKEKQSGCTVHLVNEEYDKGRILAQSIVPVFQSDTASELAKRVLAEEHKLYPKVIQHYLETLNS